MKALRAKPCACFFPRYYEMLDESGNTLVKASAVWLLMDEKNKAYGVPRRVRRGDPVP
ncbi:MAG: hypothetical protein L6V85_04730 [Clostridiales bacterium]|nr:MAG: hypothetical protein L6V85_04730 [Clostridiales bacterium]